MKAAALEGAAHGLTVNAVAPTWMRTPMVETQLAEQVRLRNATEQEVLDGLLGRQPIKRFAETGEVASAIAYLASEEASAITGTCLPVDLGTLAS